MTRQIPPSYTHIVFQAVVYEVGNRKPSRDPSGWHQQNDHNRAIVSSLRSGPEVLIGSYTLCGMPIEKDGNALESSHPIGPPWLSQKSLNEWVIVLLIHLHLQVDSIFSKEGPPFIDWCDPRIFHMFRKCAFFKHPVKYHPCKMTQVRFFDDF